MNLNLLIAIGTSLLCLVAMDPIGEESLKDKSYQKCAKMTGLDNDKILLVNKGEWPEENDTLKEWVYCVLVETNFMKVITETGEIRINVEIGGLSKREADRRFRIVNFCVPTHIYNIPIEEISWHFAKCYQEIDPKSSLF